MTASLTGKQKRHLRALAHDLKPVVQIGKNEITETVIQQVNLQLKAHELIKVKALDAEDRDTLFANLAEQCGAQLAQTLGKIGVFYKPREKDPKIVLPRVEGRG